LSEGPEIVLYHAMPSRSLIALWMLEETGLPFRIEQVSLERGEQKAPAFLEINPMGKVPALTFGDTVVTEAAAICAFLADLVPERGLAPPPGDPRRGTYYRWLFFGPSCLEPAITDRMLDRPPAPARMVGYGDFDSVIAVVEGAIRPGPFLLGRQFTAADLVLGSGLYWGMLVKALDPRPELQAYVDRLTARPAWKRAQGGDVPA
jgi:glutathione S-transferase